MGAGGMSKSQVSRLCADIDVRVNAFLLRPLEGSWPYLWLDATYIKVRDGGRIVSRAVIVAVGVNEDGKREVLGVHAGHSESAGGCAQGLRRHAPEMQDPRDAQRLGPCARQAAQRRGRDAEDDLRSGKQGRGRRPVDVVADALCEKQPKLGALMDASREDVLAYMEFPREHWSQIASTNPLERVNKESERRSDVVGIFPNDDAIVRLVGALMLETNDEWTVARRYMGLESLARVTDTLNHRLPAVAV